MPTKEEVLKGCIVEGTIIKLPNVQLDRNIYQDVAKALQKIGGKWKGGKVGGFVFDTDPTELLSEISNGIERNIKKEYQFFATPEGLADYLVELADLDNDDSILEPSAGQGAIIKAINNVCLAIPDCYELMENNRTFLNNSDLHFNLIGDDFLTHSLVKYDKIIANPPFSKNQDIEHLMKMYEYLEDGGRLVCITSESWVDGKQKKQIAFRKWLDDVNAQILTIDKGSFKDSGTLVGGRIIVINK